ASPLFSALGKTITYCGPSGTGQIVKACNQVLVALIIEAISESLVLGSKAGVAPDILLKVLSGGLAQNRFMDLRGQAMLQHAFEPSTSDSEIASMMSATSTWLQALTIWPAPLGPQ
ncbi:MAG TPA: NAD-binding protein, partial [Ktedonobacteraceae bacterium]|nr:NAD-binding protein [Ktedonobacteraceae bacterium]